MAAYNPPKQINGVPLSERTQWLLFAPMWMLFPEWRKRVMSQPISYISEGFGMLRSELRTSDNFPIPRRSTGRCTDTEAVQ